MLCRFYLHLRPGRGCRYWCSLNNPWLQRFIPGMISPAGKIAASREPCILVREPILKFCNFFPAMNTRIITILALLLFSAACAQFRVCPPNLAPPSLEELSRDENGEEVKLSGRGAFLGVSHRLVETEMFELAGVSHGYLVARVVPGSAADSIGLRARDIILQFDGITLDAIAVADRKKYFSSYIRHRKKPGDRLCLKMLRPSSNIRAKVDNRPEQLKDREELQKVLAGQGPKETLTITIDNRIRILNLEVVLGERKTLNENDVPSNSELFPEYEDLATDHIALLERLTEHFGLQGQYEDLLARYRDDELWDDGFRLPLFRYLHRDPFKLVPVLEEKTAKLAELADNAGLRALLGEGAGLLDVAVPPVTVSPSRFSGTQALLDHVVQVVDRAWEFRRKAFASLSSDELDYLEIELPELFQRFASSYYVERPDYPGDRANNERIITLAKKVDFQALFQAGLTLAELTEPQWLSSLVDVLLDGNVSAGETAEGVGGSVHHILSSKAGPVIIGGRGNNTYRSAAALIIDLGGDDLYTGAAGLVHGRQPLAAILDLEGNDQYLATESFTQGSSILGVSLLFDLGGDDLYVGTRFSQGSAVLGIGLLGDMKGDDRYYGQEFNQGAAFWGVGLLLDAGGNDSYQADLFAQGVGGVKGLGGLLDSNGDDRYFAGGREKSSYGTSGIFQGSSQGLGIGFRGYTSGGIGLLLDGDGEDSFWAGNFSQGTGYFYGLGIIRNFGNGDDVYIASRYGQGASAHSAAGLLMDDGGNDRYSGYRVALQSGAWDLGIAALVDWQGDDIYHGPHGFSQAASSHNGMALFLDYSGTDQYEGVQAPVESNEYHGGTSLSFFIDADGNEDSYSEGFNNSVTTNGEHGIRVDLADSLEKSLADPRFLQEKPMP